jgi:hypothetical protein
VVLIKKHAIKNGVNHEIAIEVAKAESSLNEKAFNPEWHYNLKGEKVCQGSFGLFQIACVHHLENPQALFDPQLNIEIAFRLHKEEGWKPWAVCTTGKVNCS